MLQCECNNVTATERRYFMQEDNLISKKALLEKYKISYGALYRWKRKGLIPEDWFIKTSTQTGQETFFPRDLITERVEMIISHKEEVLLSELAEKLSGEEKSNAKLVISTVFGEKTFAIKDIKSLKLEADGKTEDLTRIIDEFLKGE